MEAFTYSKKARDFSANNNYAVSYREGSEKGVLIFACKVWFNGECVGEFMLSETPKNA